MKNSAAQARPQATCGTSLSSNDVKRGRTMIPSSNHFDNHLCVCVIRSLCLSYLILRLRVSPRFQQQLHSCGATFERGLHERSVAIPLHIEGVREAHTIVAKRKEGGRGDRQIRGRRVDE